MVYNKHKKRSRQSACVAIKGWRGIRKAIVDRDNYMCRVCGDDPDGLHVHHIDYNRKNNESSNLVTLCGDCHRGIHFENYLPCEHEEWPIPWGKVE